MIQPQIHTGQPGVLGAQHGLTKLLSTLEALGEGQAAQQLRDAQIQEALIILAQQMRGLTAAVERLRLAVEGDFQPPGQRK